MTRFAPSFQRIAFLAAVLFPAVAFPQFGLGKDDADEDPIIRLVPKDKGAAKSAKIVEAKLAPKTGKVEDLKPGDSVVFSFTVNVPKDGYTYSMTTPKGGKTKFALDFITGLEEVDADFTADREPKKMNDPFLEGPVEKFLKPVTWSKTYRIKDGTDLKDIEIKGTVRGQVCTNFCKLIRETVAVRLPLGGNSGSPLTHRERPRFGKNPGAAEIVAKLSPGSAKPGEKVTLTVTMNLDEDWYTYSITQKPGNFAKATKISVKDLENLKSLSETFAPSKKFKIKTVELDGLPPAIQETYADKISWTKEFEVLPDAAQKGFGLKGEIDYQICKEQCVPKKVQFTLSTDEQVAIGDAPTAQPVGETAETPAKGDELDLKDIAETTATDLKQQGLMLFLVSAAGFGFVALLTPCVFPMVPITISFFLKQAEAGHHRPVTLASIYSGGIIATFTGLGLLMAALFEATSLNQLANDPWLNIVLAAVIVFFGISMLGVFEISVPSWLLTWSAGKEQRGGIIGTLFMALTFTLVSFTCTFAFAGLLLVMASKGEFLWPVLGMLAFSAAFASPFFFLALFPSFLQKLPKSGGWMNTVKVTMGFVEVGAALKFLSVADASWFGQPQIFTFHVVMTGWIITALLAGLYLLGVFRMPHDMPAKLSATRVSFAVPFLLLAVLLGAGTYANYSPPEPAKTVWQNFVAFAPIQPGESGNDPNLGPWQQRHGVRYALSFKQAVQHARETGRPLLLDFTGVNCANCRMMETVIAESPLKSQMKDFVAVQLYTDVFPDADGTGLNDDEAEDLVEFNRQLQTKWFGDVQLPMYAVVHPQELEVLERFGGFTSDYEVFEKFLNDGLEKWKTGGKPRIDTASASADGKTAQR